MQSFYIILQKKRSMFWLFWIIYFPVGFGKATAVFRKIFINIQKLFPQQQQPNIKMKKVHFAVGMLTRCSRCAPWSFAQRTVASFSFHDKTHVINAVAFTNRYSVDIFMVLGPDQSPQVSCRVLMKCCANCWDKSNRSCLLSPFFYYRPVCPEGMLSINIKAKLTLI